MFSDGSVAYLKDEQWFSFKPVKVYTSQNLGFGKWVDYK